MAFQFKRGTVLRTTRTINYKAPDGTKHTIPSGTRVKAMSKTEKGIRIKVQDKTLPALKGARIDTGYSNVKTVDRGRPEPVIGGSGAKKAGGKAKAGAAKKNTSAKKGSKPKDVIPPVVDGDEELEPTDADMDDFDDALGTNAASFDEDEEYDEDEGEDE